MSDPCVQVRVPATSANLGPGFDSLGLALDLWNTAEFTLTGEGLNITIQGEGAARLPTGGANHAYSAFRRLLSNIGQPEPAGLRIHFQNAIPAGSGLGSSATAYLMGLLAANALHGSPLSNDQLLELSAEMEGHADNVAPALLGGLCAVSHDDDGWIVRRYAIPTLQAALVLPEVNLPTHTARKALPPHYTREDAVFNLSRTALVVDALRTGDLALLGRAMQDRLHQPYRLKLIPGAEAAMQAARQAGAAAVALSGAGPSLIAFCESGAEACAEAMHAAFTDRRIPARRFLLQTTNQGASVS